MAKPEGLREHRELGRIVLQLLDGVPVGKIAAEFGVPESALRAYSQEAGLSGESKRVVPEAGSSLQGVSTALADARPAVPLETPAGQAESPPAEPDFQEQRRATQLADLAARDLAQQSYQRQPAYAVGARLRNDPLQPGHELHIGFQSSERLRLLVMRDLADKQRRIDAWKANPWNWLRPVPDDL